MNYFMNIIIIHLFEFQILPENFLNYLKSVFYVSLKYCE